MAKRDLKSRLARFDRSAPREQPVDVFESVGPTRERKPDGILARGARFVGKGPTAYLRLEARVERELWPGPPQRCVSEEAWARLGGGELPEGRHWAVLDTETTGLQSGAGTLVFLVGLLHWTSRGARLVQYLLPEPAGETRMLEALWEDLEGVDALVSFNGRAFDRSRLVNRAILHRLDPAALDKPHLDLIHPARRVAAGWMPDCRLGSIESALLRFEREDDMPGGDVPEAYQAWLHEGVEAGLLQVLDHNRMDVENLMALARMLAEFYEDGEDPCALPAEAHLALGRSLLARGRPRAARERFVEALSMGEGEVARQALAGLAREERREGRYAEAAELHRQGIRRWPHWIDARIELAKLQEHRLRDLPGAIKSVAGAFNQLSRWEALGAPRAEAREMRKQLDHRLERLHRRNRDGATG